MDYSLLRELPNMNRLLEHPLLLGENRTLVKLAARKLLDELRADILAGKRDTLPSPDQCASLVLEKMKTYRKPSLRGVVNATGIVLHTNLGRAPLGKELYALAEDVYCGYSNLEYDIASGVRGSRYAHIEGLLCSLTGAEAAMVVNNNAGAVFLMLSALAAGKQVAISRGELVEIGGSFRIPDIMAASGALLTEVGTTNRTRLKDYARAVQDGDARMLTIRSPQGTELEIAANDLENVIAARLRELFSIIVARLEENQAYDWLDQEVLLTVNKENGEMVVL